MQQLEGSASTGTRAREHKPPQKGAENRARKILGFGSVSIWKILIAAEGTGRRGRNSAEDETQRQPQAPSESAARALSNAAQRR